MKDLLLRLSSKQNITVSAASDYYIDDAAVINPDKPLTCEVMVTTAFTGTAGTTLTVAVEAATSSAFSTKKQLIVSPAVDVADLVVGKRILLPVPHNFDDSYKFIRAYFTASATFTAGAVSAYLTPDVETAQALV